MDTTPSVPSGNNQDKLMAIIACIPLLFWVPILMEKKTEYTVYFMKHGFGLLVIIMGLQIIMSFLGFFALFLIPIVSIIDLMMFAVMLYLMYHAYMGKKVIVPYYTENLEKAIIQLGIQSWFQI